MKIYKLILILTIFAFISCEDALETRPLNAYSEADIYSNIDLTETLALFTYNTTEHWGMNLLNGGGFWPKRLGIENCSDETWFHWGSRTNLVVNYSNTTPSNLGFFNGLWARKYNFIGTANNFLSKIDDSPVMLSDPDRASMLKGEMKYLRALTYQQLINYWGGVPIIDTPFGLNDDFARPRNTYEACVDFIVKELDEAISLLPAGPRRGAEFGRADKATAMALKSRVLLYAASAQHNPGESALGTNITAPRGPFYDYTKATSWKDASDAAKAVIDLNNYDLVPVSNADEYQELFVHPNAELIFGRPFSPDFPNDGGDFTSLPDKSHAPVGDGGWGLSNPTHNFVQDFKMANGMRINESGSGYDDSTPGSLYNNREMRFYANINHQGGQSKGRDLEYWSPFGKDSKDLLGNDGRHFALTGYNLRKFLDQNLGSPDEEVTPDRPFPLARIAEIYLNYAEAQYMLGNEGVAQIWASKTAQRVGLPAITSTGPALLEDIKYERQMELFYEHHRYYDLRRWMDSDKLGLTVQGVQWERRNGSNDLDANGDLVMLGPIDIDDRTFNMEDYYLPIPFNEVEKVGLDQNAGY
jgi:hypothetical protein